MRTLSHSLALAVIIALAAPIWSQTTTDRDSITGPKVAKFDVTKKRAHLEGFPNDLARYKAPGFLEVAAEIIDVDGESKVVNARKSVSIKLNLQPKSGQGETVYIESKSDEARLMTSDRTLVLTGNLSGFYRIGNGPQTMLSGSKATFNYTGDNLNALLESGAGSQVELLVPAETGKVDGLGPVTLRADELRVDQKNGAAYLTGNARAFSLGGANKIDVTAPSFTVQRASDGTLGLLTTKGKTVTKMDLPPDPSATGVGKPTHVEVTADSATVNRANSTGVFEGNVTGFYRLQAANAPAQKFDFSGESATVTYDPKAAKGESGLSIVVKLVDTEVPSFDLKF